MMFETADYRETPEDQAAYCRRVRKASAERELRNGGTTAGLHPDRPGGSPSARQRAKRALLAASQRWDKLREA